MKVSVCIPIYNERKIIERSARTLSDYMQKEFFDYEIIFFDDGSTDHCGEVIQQMQLPSARVIRCEENHGKGYAVRNAMLEADGDICLFLDADLAYGTDVIKKICDTFASNPNADLVLGSRNLQKDGYEGYTLWRKITSKLYLRLVCAVGGFQLTDSQCGCKAFSAKAVKNIFSKCEVNRFAFDFEAILWANKLGYQMVEMPVKVLHHGESKVRIIRDSLQMLKDLRSMKKRIRKAKL